MLPRYKDIVELMKKGATLEAQEQIIALREGALELQEENQELKSKIRELEDRLKEADDWRRERERYSLVSPWRGPAQVYALQKERAEGEKAHYLCSNCFHNKKKVILTPNNRNGFVVMVCPACKASIETGYRGVGAPEYAEDVKQEG